MKIRPVSHSKFSQTVLLRSLVNLPSVVFALMEAFDFVQACLLN